MIAAGRYFGEPWFLRDARWRRPDLFIEAVQRLQEEALGSLGMACHGCHGFHGHGMALVTRWLDLDTSWYIWMSWVVDVVVCRHQVGHLGLSEVRCGAENSTGIQAKSAKSMRSSCIICLQEFYRGESPRSTSNSTCGTFSVACLYAPIIHNPPKWLHLSGLESEVVGTCLALTCVNDVNAPAWAGRAFSIPGNAAGRTSAGGLKGGSRAAKYPSATPICRHRPRPLSLTPSSMVWRMCIFRRRWRRALFH